MIVEPEIRDIVEQKVAWLSSRPDPQADIVLSSRIRLARNIGNLPFPHHAAPEVRARIQNLFFHALAHIKRGNEWRKIDVHDLTFPSLNLLCERKIISPEFTNREQGRAFAVSPDFKICVMINEEDHLRIQSCAGGLQLQKIWKQIRTFVQELEQYLACSYDKELGYLTSCPTNLGTGLRGSVMLHLPVLLLTERLKPLLEALPEMGLTARGFYGEGSDFTGNLYQISNQTTLGENEEVLLDRLEKTVQELCSAEERARKEMMANQPEVIMNLCARSYGILSYAYQLTFKEMLNLFSALRLGVDCGYFPKIRLSEINRVMLTAQTAHMTAEDPENRDPRIRTIHRAEMVRRMLGNSIPPVKLPDCDISDIPF